MTKIVKQVGLQEVLDKMNVDNFPKSIKRSLRYIKQDATLKQLEEIKKVMDYAIKRELLDY